MPYLHCPNCKCIKYITELNERQLRSENLHEKCPWCQTTVEFLDLNTSMPTVTIPSPLQLPLGFKVPGPKTLKPEADQSKPLGILITDLQQWLNSQDQYTKVEFKYGRNYIVVAKLKD